MGYILTIDQGTTSSRAILCDGDLSIACSAQEDFPQHYPALGWVEHDSSDLWAAMAATCRAAPEPVVCQPLDPLEPMQADWGISGETALRVDGGMAASDWSMFLSNIIGGSDDRPEVLETIPMGAVCLAGYRAGLYPHMQVFAETWTPERRFEPESDEDARTVKDPAWKRAVAATQAA